ASELWPGLTAVLVGGRKDNDHECLAELVGTPLLLEVCGRPEGPIAVEDPRFDLMRLLTNHGVFLEFIPKVEVHLTQPTRHGAAEVEPGVPYAVALTTPAGLWACLTPLTVSFEGRNPPLLHLLAAGAQAPATAGGAVLPFPVQPP